MQNNNFFRILANSNIDDAKEVATSPPWQAFSIEIDIDEDNLNTLNIQNKSFLTSINTEEGDEDQNFIGILDASVIENVEGDEFVVQFYEEALEHVNEEVVNVVIYVDREGNLNHKELSETSENREVRIPKASIGDKLAIVVSKVVVRLLFEAKKNILQVLSEKVQNGRLNLKDKNVWRNEKGNINLTSDNKCTALFIHGTNKKNKGFSPLIKNKLFFEELQKDYELKEVIAFQHKTYSETFQENATKLSKLLESQVQGLKERRIDIFTTSRGCLVARQFMLDNRGKYNFGKVIMISGDNQGTHLVNFLDKVSNGEAFQALITAAGLIRSPWLSIILKLLRGAIDVKNQPGLWCQRVGKKSAVYKLNTEMIKYKIEFNHFQSFYTVASNWKLAKTTEKRIMQQVLSEIDSLLKNKVHGGYNHDFIVPQIGAGLEKTRFHGDLTFDLPSKNIIRVPLKYNLNGPMHGKQFEDKTVIEAIINIMITTRSGVALV